MTETVVVALIVVGVPIYTFGYGFTYQMFSGVKAGWKLAAGAGIWPLFWIALLGSWAAVQAQGRMGGGDTKRGQS